ncbi:MAG: hypothetical protein ACKOAF_01485 [Actinomycetes bacterium]
MDENVNDAAVADSVEDLMVLEEAPADLVLEVWEPTGDATVDSALEDLRALETAELGEHVQIFTSIHDQLRGRLTDLSDTARS